MTWRARIAILMAAAAALLGLTLPAASAAGELGLSPDGVTWGDTLPGPLFDPSFRWVPGDSEAASFWVRNQSTNDGVLYVTMLTGPVESLIETGDLSVSAKVDDGPYVSANTAGEHRLVNQVAVAPGEKRRVTVKVDFDPASPNVSEDQRLDLNFRVSLSQDTTVVQPPSNGGNGSGNGDGNGSSGDLPGTGTTVEPWMLLLGAGLIGAGLGLVGAARRRTRAEGAR